MKNQQANQVKITTEIERTRCQQGKLLNEYLKIKRLGEGPFSKIKLMRNIKTGKHYAMKKYNMFILKKKVRMTGKTNNKTKYSTQADEVYNEILIMKMLDHPNVVKLHQILQDDEEEKIYLIMDYCEHGDIVDWDHKKQVFINKWPLKTIAKFFKEAALGLQYLHSLNIVHRDIKPQNILITSEQTAKIIDFGRSVLLKSAEQKLSGSQGTYHFMAPQMLSQKIVGGYDGKLCDIWSLGVSIFCCVLGYLPFSDDNMMKLFEKIESSCYKQPKNLTPQQEKFMPLIKSMLPVDWTKRPCLKDICKQLQKIEKQL